MNILLATDGSSFSQAAGDLMMRLPWPPPHELTDRLLLGSVANRVVHHASCSVWVMSG